MPADHEVVVMATDTGIRAAVRSIADAIEAASTVVALTGAGISTPSGVPDFRGEDGIWNREFDPAAFHRRRFDRDPAGFWVDRLELHRRLFGDSIEPNPAHVALADLERAGQLDAVITQNTDGLHGAAGTSTVIELHGNASRAVCVECAHHIPAGRAFEVVESGSTPPRCDRCDGVLKPDVVLFGESLSDGALRAARERATEADVFLAIGSSLQVEPAASLPRQAVRNGATLVVVNLDSTPVDGLATTVIAADVLDVLPALRDAVGAAGA